jgi:hypothetical protein
MPQNLKIDEELLELETAEEPFAEEIPEIPKAVKSTSAKKVKAVKAPKVRRPKEFDIRAAHQAWKEKYGIEDEPKYY